MEPYSYEMVSNAFILFMDCIGLVSMIVALVIAVRTLKKPMDERNKAMQDTIREHTEKLDRDWETLQELKDEMGVIMTGQMLLIQHEVTHNHEDKLVEHQDFIQRYLINHRKNAQ